MRTDRIASITVIGLCALLTVGGTSLYAGKGGVKGPGGGGGSDGGTTTPTYEITKGMVSGDAYSLGVDLSALDGAVTLDVGPVPEAQLCPAGGFDEATLLKVNLLDLVKSATLFNVTAGAVGGTKAGAHSVSTVEELSLLRGLISAEVLSASCCSYTDGTTAGSQAKSAIVGLTIGGQSIDVTGAAEIRIALKVDLVLGLLGSLLGYEETLVIETYSANGTLLSSTDCLVSSLSSSLQSLLGSVVELLDSLLGGGVETIVSITLNEQNPSGDGVSTAAMSNSALHVYLHTALLSLIGDTDLEIADGTIYVSATQCGVAVNDGGDDPEPPVPPGDETGFVTGGGTIGHGIDNAAFASFGFNARPDKGRLNYVDHDNKVHIQGYSVTSFTVDGNCANFGGYAKGGHTYTAEVCDNGEPGTDDTFAISVDNGNYTNSGILSGGNIQLH